MSPTHQRNQRTIPWDLDLGHLLADHPGIALLLVAKNLSMASQAVAAAEGA